MKLLVPTLSTCVLFVTVFVGPAGAAGRFVEQGGVVVAEIEAEPPNGWTVATAPTGFTGSSAYRWDGPNYFGTPGNGTLTYDIEINSAGNYQLLLRGRLGGTNVADENDSWVRMSGQPIVGQYTIGTDAWTKLYQNQPNTWSWHTRTKDNDPQPFRQFFSAGNHRIQFSARSAGHSIDRFVLFKYEEQPWESGPDGASAHIGTLNALPQSSTTGPGQDSDDDTVPDATDVCPGDSLNDADVDGICVGTGFQAPASGDEDNCPFDANPGQQDADTDGRGDVCDQCPNATGAVEDACLGTGVWESRANSAFGHSEASVVEVDGLIYLIGGQETSSTEIYDPATNGWSMGPALPVGNLNHTQAVVVGKKIYIPGGLFGFPGPSTANVMVLDTQNLGAGWSFVAPMPTTRGSAGCAADGAKIYCAGGLSSSAGNTAIGAMEVYNTITDQWQVLTPMPRERDHFQAEIIDGKFYAVSGRDTTIGATFAFNDIYDIATDTWTQGAPLPTPRGGYASEVLEGRLLIIGGEGGGPSNGAFPDVEEYDPARNVWRALTDLPSPRHGFAAAISTAEDGVTRKMYVMTGSQSQGGGNSSINEVFYFGVQTDNDGDGFAPPGDCNDDDDTVFPGAPELCDNKDNDCDGNTDEGNPGGGGSCSAGAGQGQCAFGVLTCISGGIQCVPNTPGSEICDGLDNDCDGSTDEGNPGGGATCSTGQPGVCSTGTTQCSGGSLQCIPNQAPGVEACDGLDNDCDGSTDEGNPGGGATCSTGQLGVCGSGTLQCQGGGLLCVQDTGASAEVCDGLDNDCDGSTDEGNPGGGVSCSTGTPGVCASGTTQCSTGSVQCLPNTPPSAETCDGLDNDCDGNIDEGNPGGGGDCSTGQPGACEQGTQICQGGALNCVQAVNPTAETCNNIDDDCDGSVDEGNPGGGGSCSTGLPGACSAGIFECQSGLLQCVGTGGTPELCDGTDNDCDGTVDDGNPEGGASCSTGQPGLCDTGIETCTAGSLQCEAVVAPSPEVCDSGLDEDCDGEVDEGSSCELCTPENTYELPAQTSRTILKFPLSASSDKVISKGAFVMPAPQANAPELENVTLRVVDEVDTVYEVLIPAGMLTKDSKGRKFQYKDADRPFEPNGVKQARMVLQRDLITFKYKLKALDLTLPDFNGPMSAVTVKIGDLCYTDPSDTCTTATSGKAVRCR